MISNNRHYRHLQNRSSNKSPNNSQYNFFSARNNNQSIQNIQNIQSSPTSVDDFNFTALSDEDKEKLFTHDPLKISNLLQMSDKDQLSSPYMPI